MEIVLSPCAMQLKNLKEGLAKILKLCSRNGFFDIKTFENSLISLRYGPLGTLFRRNISREWLSSIVNNSDVFMFPLEVQVLKKQSKSLKDLSRSTDLLLKDVVKNYMKTLPVVGADVPYGFAAYGPTIALDNSTINQEVTLNNSLISNFEYRHWLCVVFFCSMKESSNWFNYWSRHRYRWWRKFSSIPSKFSMSDVFKPTIGEQQMSLLMEFPWGKEKLETITLYNESFIKSCCDQITLNGSENISPSIIVCEAELDVAAFAYLTNSFAEKWRANELRNLFQFHVKLAPYKVCMFLKSDNPDSLRKLKDVARHLEKELKKCRITVFPCSVNCNLEFSRFDEMGIPYTIILTERALHSGVAGLRNRDTTLEEQIHITELTPKLLKYLQMNSFDTDENF